MTEIVRVTDSVNLDELQRMAQIMAHSGYFKADADAKKGLAQMAAKMLAGRELGYGPFASITGIHIISGTPAISANLMAAAIKAHPRYNYKVRKMTPDAVSLEFFDGSESLGTSEFTIVEAKAASLDNKPVWKQFPRNMLFARALSNGVRWYCPDVFNGNTVYVPEELGADVDGEGNVTAQPAYTVIETATTPQKPAIAHTQQPRVEAPKEIKADPAEQPTRIDVAGKDDFDRALNEIVADDEKINKAFHATGSNLFGTDWNNGARAWLITEYTRAKTPNDIRSSSKDLINSERQALIDDMSKNGPARVKKYAQAVKVVALETQMHGQLVAAAA